ncbi:hypothetical protein H6P81_002667 [Aristolochia fimbriata]|uniref:Uncharacterized protein n=1 Tax=Aristolochia fimbriata TaxID=158543 RepID=A0AAV7FAZ4_ARIFI|nr:hypothetical protein H6P81_002667 [Aristolochia fimbriata]
MEVTTGIQQRYCNGIDGRPTMVFRAAEPHGWGFIVERNPNDAAPSKTKSGDGSNCNSHTDFSLKSDGDPVGTNSDILEAETSKDSKDFGDSVLQ